MSNPESDPEYPAETPAIRCVTVGQLLGRAAQQHSTASFLLDGQVIKLTVLVGNAYDIAVRSTHLKFKLDDGTGEINVILWTEECPYVRVTGELYSNKDKKTVRARSIKPAPNPYEIFAHILRAIYEINISEKGPPPSQYAETQGSHDEPPEEQMPEIDMDRDASFILPSEPTAQRDKQN
ncbi:hypothetical protein DFH07DRAFT_986367 [Mycena maculata]|uniref:OB domain-containing protein n=1 Tax=Mycena maculata TaxID=230809 RepID=A0AAD7NTD7_9AGAR|nr:hypothetical protein DFH07DRAFT_986367 [Mycena maculata]